MAVVANAQKKRFWQPLGRIRAGSTGESVPQSLADEVGASHGDHLIRLRMCGLVAGAGAAPQRLPEPFFVPFATTYIQKGVKKCKI